MEQLVGLTPSHAGRIFIARDLCSHLHACMYSGAMLDKAGKLVREYSHRIQIFLPMHNVVETEK